VGFDDVRHTIQYVFDPERNDADLNYRAPHFLTRDGETTLLGEGIGVSRYSNSAQEPFVAGVVHIDGSNTVTYVTETGASSECPRR
jgi:hypothetical protein